VILVPLLCLGFLRVAENGGVGALGAKAELLVAGEGWEAYLSILAQMVAVTLFIGPGVVVTWAFGREHAEHTFPSLFALPVPRRSIAGAKFIVLLSWGALLSVLVVAASALLGLVVGVGSTADVNLAADLARLTVAGFLTTTIALSIGLVASIGRGYLPAIGAVILLTAAAQVAVLFGTGGWFPFAAPGLYAMSGVEGVTQVGLVQLLLVPLTASVAVWATMSWWHRAEVV
jgi:ABC-2 type transport system permease protein